MTTNQTLYPSAAGLIGNVGIARNIFPTVRSSIRRLDPDGSSNVPYYPFASGKTLVLEYTTEPSLAVLDSSIVLTSNSISQIITDINSAVPGVIQAFEQDGFLFLRNLNPGKTHLLTVVETFPITADAASILGFAVSPFPGSTSYAGEYSPTPSSRKELNPQTTALMSRDEDLSAQAFNRSFYAILQLVETMRADLARDVVVYKDIELTFSEHATDGIISAPINDDSIRVFVPPFDIDFDLPIAAFRLNPFHRVLDTFGQAAVQDFHDPGDPTSILVSNFFYATAGTPFTPNTLFSVWGTPNGGSVVGAGDSVSNADKHAFTDITRIVGNIVECSSASFVTKKIQQGDPVELVAANLFPFDHSGWFAVDAIIDETHLAIRPMGTSEAVPDITHGQIKPRWLNPGAGGTLRVAMGRFIPAGDLFVSINQSSLSTGGSNHIIRLSIGVPFIRTLSEDQARGFSGGLDAVATILKSHMQSSTDAHPAASITGFTSATTWRDGTSISGGTVKSTIEDILTDLKAQATSNSGSGRIGAEAISIGGSTPNALASGTVLSQLIALLTSLRDHVNQASNSHAASSISYAGGGSWADGTTNPVTTVEGQLDKIIVDLGGTGGASKIKYDGGPVWADSTTNPATTVEGQLDKIITDLGGTGGASKIKYDGGAAWADTTTNPTTTVEGQLDKIINDLSASTGSAKIGGAATSTDIAAGTLAAQIANLAVNWLKMSRANTIAGAQTFSALLTSAAITASGVITANAGLTTSSGITYTSSAEEHFPDREFSIDCSDFQIAGLHDGTQGELESTSIDGSNAIVVHSLVIGAGNASGQTKLVASMDRIRVGDKITSIILSLASSHFGIPNNTGLLLLESNSSTSTSDNTVFSSVAISWPTAGTVDEQTFTVNYTHVAGAGLRLIVITSATSAGQKAYVRYARVKFQRP